MLVVSLVVITASCTRADDSAPPTRPRTTSTATSTTHAEDDPASVLDDIPGGGSAADREAYREARARWEEHGPRSYRYRIERGCFCPVLEATVVVRDGRVIQVRPRGETARRYANMYLAFTVDDLFDQIDRYLAGPASIGERAEERGSIHVSYDPILAYPRHASFDPILNAIDDEGRYTITDFDVLDTGHFASPEEFNRR